MIQTTSSWRRTGRSRSSGQFFVRSIGRTMQIKVRSEARLWPLRIHFRAAAKACSQRILDSSYSPGGTHCSCKLDAREPAYEHRHACLCALCEASLAKRISEALPRFSMSCLTEHGVASVKAGFRLQNPPDPLAIRDDVELSQRTVWELMVLLDQDGWIHAVKEKGSDAPYNPDGGQKVRYSNLGLRRTTLRGLHVH